MASHPFGRANSSLQTAQSRPQRSADLSADFGAVRGPGVGQDGSAVPLRLGHDRGRHRQAGGLQASSTRAGVVVRAIPRFPFPIEGFAAPGSMANASSQGPRERRPAGRRGPPPPRAAASRATWAGTQFHFPSSVIAAGTRTEWTIVASMSSATATPKPICWNMTRSPAAKPTKTATMMRAALLDSRSPPRRGRGHVVAQRLVHEVRDETLDEARESGVLDAVGQLDQGQERDARDRAPRTSRAPPPRPLRRSRP